MSVKDDLSNLMKKLGKTEGYLVFVSRSVDGDSLEHYLITNKYSVDDSIISVQYMSNMVQEQAEALRPKLVEPTDEV